MRPEDFDKRIQQKLEDLNPAFNEKDWTRLSQKMNLKQAYGILSKRNGLILLLLLFVFITSWISFRWYYGINEMQPQPFIKADNSAILAKTGEAGPDQVVSNSENGSASKDKTITNKTEGNSITPDFPIVTNPNSSDLQNARSEKTKVNKVNSNSIAEPLTNGSGNKMNVSINSSSLQSTINNQLVENQQISESNSTAEKAESISDINTINDNIPAYSKTTEAQSLNSVSSLKLLELPGLSSTDNRAVITKLKPTAGIKPHKWIIGPTGLGAAAHFNTGLALEIKTRNNISFGTGLVYQHFFNQNYTDQKAFTETNEAEFTELIRPRHSKSVSFMDIRISSMDVLLPLQLKYYVPISRRYALFANAGIQLTLYTKTSLDFAYQTYDDPGPLLESDFEQASNSATLINHFNIGAGIQREFKNFILQTGFVLQKNNSNQPQIEKLEPAGQIGFYYKL